MIKVIRGYKCPRWLWGEIDLPAEERVEIDPATFSNEEIYRWALTSLMFAGDVKTKTASAPYDNAYGGIGRRVLVEVGKSGCSDMNLVPAPLTALCGNPHKVRQHDNVYNDGVAVRLPYPYTLPRDTGLDVVFENADITAKNMPVMTFIAKGVRDDGHPAFLAGESEQAIENGNEIIVSSADLFNRGKDELHIHTLCFKNFDADASAQTLTASMTHINCLINPTSGMQWMPVTPIPLGLLAPMNRMLDDLTDLAPHTYFFPRDTYLDPEQRLSVRITNLTDADQKISVALFGTLEVE